MPFRTTLAAALVALSIPLAGCGLNTAESQRALRLEGTVTAIDQATRRITIQGPSKTVTFTAGEEVRNFPQVQVGDTVAIDYAEAGFVRMAEPGESGISSDAAAIRAPEGARPGAAAAESGTVVVTFLGYDPASKQARIQFPDGSVESVYVPASMREFAATRTGGDRLLIQLDRAVALTVTPA